MELRSVKKEGTLRKNEPQKPQNLKRKCQENLQPEMPSLQFFKMLIFPKAL